jgi:hypothetical protein
VNSRLFFLGSFLALSIATLGGCAATDDEPSAATDASQLRSSDWIEEPEDFSGLLGTYVAANLLLPASAPSALHSLTLSGTDDSRGALGTYVAKSCALCMPETGSLRAGFSFMTIGSFIQLTPAGEQASDKDFYLLLAIKRDAAGKVSTLKLSHYAPGGAVAEAFEMTRFGF